ncbi:outer membrane protein assembly factor BamB [Bordetella genomosp. 8]|uniref:Outer membrane protein assembly factor BamB n=1 Tax=Bordetella genomosp. 8 TaxID=1416806 RepID=A0A1W6YIW2_9BORD|nr:outer membrane protein assembly factor BamB [Bordetella genomosp. 8]ARP81007.1 outer membrane protein assembly factor BamB [Bordetella genomosp. 8]
MFTLAFRRSAIVAACVAAALSLGACSLFSKDDTRYDPAPLTDYKPGMSVRQAWSVSIGSGGGLGFYPSVVGEAVYAAAPNGMVGKYDLLSGRAIWRTDTKADLTAGAGSDGTTTVVASNAGDVIAYDDTGKQKWKVRATSEISEPPLVNNGLVVVRSGDYRITAFDARNGDRVWSVQRPGPALALRTTTQMIMAQGLVIAGLPGGKMMAISADSGNVQWEGTVATPKGGSDLERLNDVVGAPRLIGPLMCAVAYQGRIVCFDVSQGGRPVWAKDFSGAVGLGADDNAVYAPDSHSIVYAYSLRDGSELWKQAGLRNRRLTAPVAIGPAIAVGDYDGYVHFLSRSDGHLLARLSVGGDAVLSPLQTTSQGVLVQTGNGNLVMIATN